MSAALRPYLARSLFAHAAAAAAVVLLAPRTALKPPSSYRIDFVGGPAAAAPSTPGPAAAAPAAAGTPAAPGVRPRAARPGGLAPRRGVSAALPRPSLLGRTRTRKPERAAAADDGPSLAGPGGPEPGTSPAAAGEPDAAAPAAAAGPGAGVSTDLPNFPYPWYVSQVRLLLWHAWQRRMPRLDAEGVVAFLILRSGAVTDLIVESSSGEAGFDRLALESVRAAVPFPPLPEAFGEPFLKIHLALKSVEARP